MIRELKTYSILGCRLVRKVLNYFSSLSESRSNNSNQTSNMLANQFLSKALLLRNAGAVSRAAYHAGGHHQHSTMNDLPVPEGDWHEQHSRKNTKYNTVLITGILVLAGTIGFAKSSGIVFLNSSPPKSLD